MTPHSSWFADPPPWGDFDDEGDRDRWLKYLDDYICHLFQEEQAEAASMPDLTDNFDTENSTKSDRTRLSVDERRVLLACVTSKASSRWKSLAELMRSGNTSIELNEILADMVEFGGFHLKAKFNKVHVQEDSELAIYSHFKWVCDALRGLYPEKDPKAISARAKKVVANFIADGDSSMSQAEAERRVRRVTTGWESDPGRARLTLVRARVEMGEQFMLGRCRVYRR